MTRHTNIDVIGQVFPASDPFRADFHLKFRGITCRREACHNKEIPTYSEQDDYQDDAQQDAAYYFSHNGLDLDLVGQM
jgi:hypothetical protein